MTLNNYSKNFFLLFLLFISLILIIFLREPCWLIEGSFQRDDFGYYKLGKMNSFLGNIFQIQSGTGALMFLSNIINAITSLFSYDVAKILSKYLVVIVYLFIFFYIYFTKSSLLTSKKHKIFSILVILLSPPMTPEVWMSSAHLRGYFGIFSFILLFNDHKKEKKIINYITNFLIFTLGVSSIYSVALMPAYFLKFYFNKNKKNFYNFLSSLFAFLIQFIAIINYILSSFTTTVRFHFDPSAFYSYFYNVIIRSFFGSAIPKFLFFNNGIYSMQYFTYFIYFILILISLITLRYISKKNNKDIFIMFVALIIVSGLIIIGSIQPGFAGGRYAVVPGVMIIFIVFKFFIIENNIFLKNFFLFLLITTITVGAIEYKYKSPFTEALKCRDYSHRI
tara:strand:+ start:124 stop:1302 length:1179 start_codon:yes stop_codon:yes gene_type:complete